MNLYLLERTDDWGYCQSLGFVIAAETEARARTIAAEADDYVFGGDKSWELFPCVVIGVAAEDRLEGVVLNHYYDG